MNRKHKILYKVFTIGFYSVILILIIFGISQVLSYLNSGADRSSMLHLELNKEEVYLPKVIWKDTTNPGRPIEKQTLEDIEKDYLNAWYVRQVAYQTNITTGIENYYTTRARKPILEYIRTNENHNISIRGTTTHHNLSLEFYSADGQLVGLKDSHVKEYQRVYKDNNLMIETSIESDYRIVLLLEDGFWRIRHLLKEESEIVKDTLKSKSMNTVSGKKIYAEGVEYQIKGINYYPQKTPWDMFGNNFDMTAISKDFDMIRSMNLNTIRIFVGYEDFGKADVLLEKLQKLRQVLDMAEEKNLKVIVTLFDFYGDYSVLDWTLTHRHAEQIVTEFKAHKAILAWDIKNEPNLDFSSRSKERVMSWLQEMIVQVKTFAPNHLVTIGWSDAESATLLQDKVDMVSFHYYQDVDSFEEIYQKLDMSIDKPIVLQEYGLSSNIGLWNPFGVSERGQAAYYKRFLEILKKNPINYMSWTLYDYHKIPSSVVGNWPWRKQKQKHFGCIDKDGNKKKSFEFIEAVK